MTGYTAAYYFDQTPGRGAVSGIVTGDSIDAGHAWLIAELTPGARAVGGIRRGDRHRR